MEERWHCSLELGDAPPLRLKAMQDGTHFGILENKRGYLILSFNLRFILIPKIVIKCNDKSA